MPPSRLLGLATAFAVLVMPASAADFPSALEAYQDGDYKTAYREFRVLAQEGDPFSQYNLGIFLTDDGLGVERDYKEAAKWYRKAAEQGHADAQFKLALMYGYGYGVERDREETLKWFTKAAEQGNIDAQYNVAFMYRAGRDVPRDDIEAAKWFRKAADQGSRNAAAMLGVMYAKGEGVPKDNQSALRWLNMAAENGHERARQDRAYLMGHVMQIKEVALRIRRHLDDGLGLADGDDVVPFDEDPSVLAHRNQSDEF